MSDNENTGSVKKRKMMIWLHQHFSGKCVRCGCETGLSFYLEPQGWTRDRAELNLFPPDGDTRQSVRIATRYRGRDGWVLLCRVCNPGNR